MYNVDKAMVYVMVAGVKPKIVQIWGSLLKIFSRTDKNLAEQGKTLEYFTLKTTF